MLVESGVRAHDRVTGETFDIRAKHVIFAGGPFTDALRQKEDGTSRPIGPAVSGASGTHIVLPGYYAPKDMGLLDYNTSDGRFLFFLPWQSSETLPYPPEEEIDNQPWWGERVAAAASPGKVEAANSRRGAETTISRGGGRGGWQPR